jgi:hypothetical protein
VAEEATTPHHHAALAAAGVRGRSFTTSCACGRHLCLRGAALQEVHRVAALTLRHDQLPLRIPAQSHEDSYHTTSVDNSQPFQSPNRNTAATKVVLGGFQRLPRQYQSKPPTVSVTAERQRAICAIAKPMDG